MAHRVQTLVAEVREGSSLDLLGSLVPDLWRTPIVINFPFPSDRLELSESPKAAEADACPYVAF
jgi:hypothetical protein